VYATLARRMYEACSRERSNMRDRDAEASASRDRSLSIRRRVVNERCGSSRSCTLRDTRRSDCERWLTADASHGGSRRGSRPSSVELSAAPSPSSLSSLSSSSLSSLLLLLLLLLLSSS